MKRIVALLLAAGGALVVCSTAFADALTCGHSAAGCGPGQNGQFTPPGTGANLGSTHTAGVGALPFTGLNLAVVAIAAVLLLASGLVLRRMTRRPQ